MQMRPAFEQRDFSCRVINLTSEPSGASEQVADLNA